MAIWMKAPHFLSDWLGGWATFSLCEAFVGLILVISAWIMQIHQRSTTAHGIIGPSPPRIEGY